MGLTKNDLKIAKGGWEILKRNLDRIVSLTLNMLAFSRHRSIELELTPEPLAISCRFTLCHPPSVDDAFLNVLRHLMRRLGMRILENPHPEPAWLQTVGILDRPG